MRCNVESAINCEHRNIETRQIPRASCDLLQENVVVDGAENVRIVESVREQKLDHVRPNKAARPSTGVCFDMHPRCIGVLPARL